MLTMQFCVIVITWAYGTEWNWAFERKRNPLYSGFLFRSNILWLREMFRGLFYGSVYHGNYSDGFSSTAGVHLNSFRGIYSKFWLRWNIPWFRIAYSVFPLSTESPPSPAEAHAHCDCVLHGNTEYAIRTESRNIPTQSKLAVPPLRGPCS